MRIIIASGGTGGHVFPAISIAEEITRRNSNTEVLFVGTRKGIEKKVVSEKGYNIRFITSGGLIGKNLMQKIKGILSAFYGIISSFSIVRKFKPDIVLGVGGYASGPTVLSAFISLIPTAICEQNSVPGFTNRILSKFAKKIFITFEDSKKYFPNQKIILTGNPIRTDLLNKISDQKIIDKEKFNLLVLGGSQGAAKLNKVVPKCLKNLNNISVIHQSGEKDFNEVKKLYNELKIPATVYKFVDDIADIYSKTDLIICRSGAGTLSEITALGIPSILVPFPYAAHNHQLFNAKILEKNNAALIIEEDNLTEEKLFKELNEILNLDTLNKLSLNSRKLGKPKAASDIVNELEKLIGNKQCTGK